MSNRHVVIAGAGLAGVQVADTLRAEGFPGRITLVSAESVQPYERPPLSKGFLDPANDVAHVVPLRPAAFYPENEVELLLGVRVVGIDRERQKVRLEAVAQGDAVPAATHEDAVPTATHEDAGRTDVDAGDVPSELSYTDLVLATGARNRPLPIKGGELDGVLELRELGHAQDLRRSLKDAGNVVVVGGGFIGLEFASAAALWGAHATVLEFAERPMARVLSPAMSEYFAGEHARRGVRLQLGEAAAEILAEDPSASPTTIAGTTDRRRVKGVRGSSGQVYPADLVLIAAGVVPNEELAVEAGLATANGISVDATLQTSDPHIWAIGDCVSFPSRHTGTILRLESEQNATDQGRYLGKRLLGRTDEEYSDLPWFWTHQGDLKLYIAGVTLPGDETLIRGDLEAGRFSVFSFRSGILSAVESVSQPSDHVAARRTLGAGRGVTPGQVADPGFDFKAFSKGKA
ncbi:FAD-dependent oxidoreductase [Saxibacter everestensis]|uniref:FAD-dependent oxidoreductase n=1 Tax=Saxibacter everestensis TaxID=2909229 RepID=A0ABY8QVT6_9MICO|nr:FAD-dependent oxidoreductase [Brevibacteriaceae bacterium ZFBP1038]